MHWTFNEKMQTQKTTNNIVQHITNLAIVILLGQPSAPTRRHDYNRTLRLTFEIKE